MPPGRYLIASHLVVPSNVTLEGIFAALPTTPWQNNAMGQPEFVGSVLLAVEGAGKAEGTPFVQLKTNATLKGLAVFYPEQKDADPPVPYPWTISSSLHGEDNCSILDVLLINPYQAVDFGGRATGRHLVRNLYGQALYRGLFIDHCLDVGRVENVHLWPFWNPNGPAAEFTRREGKAFVIGRTDWQSMISCFCISYETGFHFVRCCGSHPAYQGGGNAQIIGGGGLLQPRCACGGDAGALGHAFRELADIWRHHRGARPTTARSVYRLRPLWFPAWQSWCQSRPHRRPWQGQLHRLPNPLYRPEEPRPSAYPR